MQPVRFRWAGVAVLLFVLLLLAVGPLPAAPGLTIVGQAPADLAQARPADLRAGAAVADMTPPQSMWTVRMIGWDDPNQLPTGVHDPLLAKVLVLDNGQVRLALVTIDLLMVSMELRREVVARLPAAAGISPDRLLICASHTHSAPGGLLSSDLGQQLLGTYQPAMVGYMAAKIAGAVGAAAAGLAPAKVGWASGQVADIAFNRRSWAGNTLVNSTVATLRVDTAAGKPLAVLVNIGVHPVYVGEENRLLSADFVGYLVRQVERTRGGVAMFANDGQGDQDPKLGTNGKMGAAPGYAYAKRFGERLGREAARIAGGAVMRRQVALGSILGSFETPPPTLPIGPTELPLMAFRVGDVLLLGIPGEPTAELALEMRRQAYALGFRMPLVLGLANDMVAYILQKPDFEKGGYEAETSFYGPDLGPLLVRATGRLAAALHPVAD